MTLGKTVLAGLALALVASAANAGEVKVAPDQKYLLLSATRTGTMEQELTDSAKMGFRVVLSASSGLGMLFLLERAATPPDLYEYKIVATTQLKTLERELNEVAAQGFRLIPGATMPKEKMIGPREVLCLLEKEPGGAAGRRYEYKVLGTARTGTLEKEIQENQKAGFELAGLATANEHTVIMERAVSGTAAPQ